MINHSNYFEDIQCYIQQNDLEKKVQYLYSSDNNGVYIRYENSSVMYRELPTNFRDYIKRIDSTKKIGFYIETLYQSCDNEIKERLNTIGFSKQYKHKVVNNKIKPSKEKLLCFAVSLKMSLEQTEELLRRGGYTLARDTSQFDQVLGYFFENNIYQFTEIDEALIDFGERPLFSVA